MKSEKEILDDIKATLEQKGVKYEIGAVIGNALPDAYFITPTGHSVAVEVKLWDATQDNRMRATKLAKTFESTAGTTNAFVVLPGTFRSSSGSSVFSINEFSKRVENILMKSKVNKQLEPPVVKKAPAKYIFAAMPFASEFDDTYNVTIRPAALINDIDAIRVDYKEYAGNVVDKIKDLISNSIGLIADLSNSRPNVLYEVGYAEALGKPCIQICSPDLKNLPFDVRNDNTKGYSRGQTTLLRDKLIKSIKEIY